MNLHHMNSAKRDSTRATFERVLRLLRRIELAIPDEKRSIRQYRTGLEAVLLAFARADAEAKARAKANGY